MNSAILEQRTSATKKSILPPIYSPWTQIDYGLVESDDDESIKIDTFSVRTRELTMFDAYGNRAPYREGPYDYHHNDYGRLIKKRWCECSCSS